MAHIEQQPFPFEQQRGYELKNIEGTGRLDILMRATPSGRHYDPEQISIPTPEDTRRLLGRSSLLHLPTTPVLMPGAIQLNDRLNKRAAFTTFGGIMQITPFGENVEISVISTGAPILDIRDPKSTDTLIAAEFEALVAKDRAKYLIEMCQNHGYSPNAAIVEFNTTLSQLSPGVQLEAFLQRSLQGMNENKKKKVALKRPMQEFVYNNEQFIGALPSANDIYYLATGK